MTKNVMYFLLCSIFLSTSTAFAKFVDVESAFCDGEQIHPSQGQRLYLDFQKSVFGIEKNLIISGNDCRVVDFYTVLVTHQTNFNANKVVVFEPVQEVGRRSNCISGLSPFDGTSFEKGTYTKNTLTLESTDDCGALKFNLSSE